MVELRIFSPITNFAVVVLIGMRTLNTMCFSAFDINLSLAGLVFSVLVEILNIKKR